MARTKYFSVCCVFSSPLVMASNARFPLGYRNVPFFSHSSPRLTNSQNLRILEWLSLQHTRRFSLHNTLLSYNTFRLYLLGTDRTEIPVIYCCVIRIMQKIAAITWQPPFYRVITRQLLVVQLLTYLLLPSTECICHSILSTWNLFNETAWYLNTQQEANNKCWVHLLEMELLSNK
jgi:hypothetical protein